MAISSEGTIILTDNTDADLHSISSTGVHSTPNSQILDTVKCAFDKNNIPLGVQGEHGTWYFIHPDNGNKTPFFSGSTGGDLYRFAVAPDSEIKLNEPLTNKLSGKQFYMTNSNKPITRVTDSSYDDVVDIHPSGSNILDLVTYKNYLITIGTDKAQFLDHDGDILQTIDLQLDNNNKGNVSPNGTLYVCGNGYIDQYDNIFSKGNIADKYIGDTTLQHQDVEYIMEINAWGAGGGMAEDVSGDSITPGKGGNGGFSRSTIDLQDLQSINSLLIVVGEGGDYLTQPNAYGGGGQSSGEALPEYGGGGGGYSGVFSGTTVEQSSALVVVGGGGGGGSVQDPESTHTNGGHGGGGNLDGQVPSNNSGSMTTHHEMTVPVDSSTAYGALQGGFPGSFRGGGGGGGYWGGRGGRPDGTFTPVKYIGGVGGSGYISNNFTTVSTEQLSGDSFSDIQSQEFYTGSIASGATDTTQLKGGNGLVVIAIRTKYGNKLAKRYIFHHTGSEQTLDISQVLSDIPSSFTFSALDFATTYNAPTATTLQKNDVDTVNLSVTDLKDGAQVATKAYVDVAIDGASDINYSLNNGAPQIRFDVWGAGGGRANNTDSSIENRFGGNGGYATGVIPLTELATLGNDRFIVVVGEGGHTSNVYGGGKGVPTLDWAGGSGGYSGLFLGAKDHSNSFVIAGGGGGGGLTPVAIRDIEHNYSNGGHGGGGNENGGLPFGVNGAELDPNNNTAAYTQTEWDNTVQQATQQSGFAQLNGESKTTPDPRGSGGGGYYGGNAGIYGTEGWMHGGGLGGSGYIAHGVTYSPDDQITGDTPNLTSSIAGYMNGVATGASVNGHTGGNGKVRVTLLKGSHVVHTYDFNMTGSDQSLTFADIQLKFNGVYDHPILKLSERAMSNLPSIDPKIRGVLWLKSTDDILRISRGS